MCHLLPCRRFQHSNFWGDLSPTSPVSILSPSYQGSIQWYFLPSHSSYPSLDTLQTLSLTIRASQSKSLFGGTTFLNNVTCVLSSFGVPPTPILLPHHDLLGIDCTTFLLLILSLTPLFSFLLVYIPCSTFKSTPLHPSPVLLASRP